MHFRYLLYCCLCLQSSLLYMHSSAQTAPAHHVSVISENDNYALRHTDHYYTNGLMLRYVQAQKNTGRLLKKLFTAEAGQLIFTPYTFNRSFEKYMDRPFTGFLYARAAQTRFYKGGTMFQWGGLIGVIGSAACGKEVQRWHHRNFGLRYPHGWEQGLKTAVGIDLQGNAAQPLLSAGRQRFGFQASATAGAQAGMLFTQASAGLLLRIGAALPAHASAIFDGGAGREQAGTEWYFFAAPQLAAQWHNATLEGGRKHSPENAFTTKPRRFIYQHSFGAVWAPHRWMIKLGFNHRTKEAETMRASENWGTIALGYKW